MTEEATTYEQLAENALAGAAATQRPERATELLARAQVYATLAVAEQSRIANVLAFSDAGPSYRTDRGLYVNAQTDRDATFAIWQLAPEIAAELKIEHQEVGKW